MKTRKACSRCNDRAGQEIDDPFADQLMVRIPKALNDVRSIRKQGKVPLVETTATISSTGEPATARLSPQGRAASDSDGGEVTELVEVVYGMTDGLWSRFAAKSALGCASLIMDDEWNDSPLANGLRSILWHQPIDDSIWPEGVPALPDELPMDHIVRNALGERQHIVSLLKAEGASGSAVASIFLFGGALFQRLPLPGFSVDGAGPTWVINSDPSPPPKQEDFEEAIVRLLREQGWEEEQIRDALQQPAR